MDYKKIKVLIATLGVNYDGRPLAPNEVLVLSHQDKLFISENVTNPDSIVPVTIPNTGKTVTAVLMAVDRQFADIARAQFNSWVNDYLGHNFSKMTTESIEDRQERELPERGQSCSAEDIVVSKRTFEDSIRTLIQCDPQSAYAALLKVMGYKGSEFDKEMQLGHNASNKATKKMEHLLTELLAGKDIEIRANNTQRTTDYRRKAKKILDELIEFI